MTRQPATSVHCGLTQAGLPVGLQIVGPLYSEALVLRAATALEATNPAIVWPDPLSGEALSA
jgi:aspartyl-tRNA(Asn)/glutamyl-tRNA(Gln) amidotransferase subunit A